MPVSTAGTARPGDSAGSSPRNCPRQLQSLPEHPRPRGKRRWKREHKNLGRRLPQAAQTSRTFSSPRQGARPQPTEQVQGKPWDSAEAEPKGQLLTPLLRPGEGQPAGTRDHEAGTGLSRHAHSLPQSPLDQERLEKSPSGTEPGTSSGQPLQQHVTRCHQDGNAAGVTRFASPP